MKSFVYIVMAGSTYYPTGDGDVVGVRPDLEEAVDLARKQPGDWRSVVRASLDDSKESPCVVWRDGAYVAPGPTLQARSQ